MSWLWVTDPWDTLSLETDTTLRLIEEAVALKIKSHWCDRSSIRIESGQVLVDAWEMRGHSERRKPQTMPVSRFRMIHYRVDPPINQTYLHPLQMLKLAARGQIINSPEALFSRNEKFEALGLKNMTPRSLVSGELARLEAFGKKLGQAVLKPLDQAQSKGVELLSWKSPKEIALSRKTLVSATQGAKRAPVMLQEYLKGISRGETRLWFSHGRLLAQVIKKPLKGDFRVNVDAGSEILAAPLSARDKATARKICNYLKNHRIRLAAVDLIDGKITDFNFTSPGLIVQMEQILERNLANEIVSELIRSELHLSQ